MARWKNEVVDKIQALPREPIPHNVPGVLLAEFAEISGIDDHAFAPLGLQFSRLQPAASDPAFYRVRTNVKSDCQRVLGEAVLAHFGVCAEPVEHVPDGAFRSPHYFRDLGNRMEIEELQEALLFRRRP